MNLKFLNKLGLSESRLKENKKFIVIFYVVGISGMLIPFTSYLFKLITPFALFLNFVILAAYHKGSYNAKTLLVFTGIYFCGFFIEMIGVGTSLIFGNYIYGNALGIKVFETPLIIGLNWLFLCYVSNAILENYKINIIFKIIIASFMMLIYDIVLEQVAAFLDFWKWENNKIPIQNYIAWFAIALIFNSFINFMKISTKNSMAKIIFVSQFLFFTAIYIYYILI